jgi:ubiquinol-cytochrome c reductase cytochrome b subunit
VPERMNKLESAGAPGTGRFLTADPASEREPPAGMEHDYDRSMLTAVRKHQQSQNGSTDARNNKSPPPG